MIDLDGLDWHAFLDRPALPSPPPEAFAALRRESILITGAGGSIGSAIVRRLAASTTRTLLLLEASEGDLFALQKELAVDGTVEMTSCFLGSIADKALLEHIFSTHAPHLVFHAAAFKNVPLLELQPLAAMANNIFGTATLLDVAAEHAARVLLLSTDKAVEPSSIMGATKRVAEQIVLASSGIVVRLGNVLGSRGSVVELFARQIQQGGPVTITSPNATRYFLTLDEAVNLLIAAALTSDAAPLLAPALIEARSVADLAQFMMCMLGAGRECEIRFIGLRPGDKEHEKFWRDGSTTRPTILHGLVAIDTAPPDAAKFYPLLAQLRTAVDARDLPAAMDFLGSLLPEYTPSLALQMLADQPREHAGIWN